MYPNFAARTRAERALEAQQVGFSRTNARDGGPNATTRARIDPGLLRVAREALPVEAQADHFAAFPRGSHPGRAAIDPCTFDDRVRDRVLSAIKRIVTGGHDSGAPKPPAFTTLNELPLTVNDEGAPRTVTEALSGRSGGAELFLALPPSARIAR